MGEYQYYEFLAVDRPLGAEEQAEVRELSTRAEITATGFVNEYEWGDFKGEPRRLMERYYDAHLYLADWGTRHVMLRLPKGLLSSDAVAGFLVDGYVEAWGHGEHVLVELTSEEEEGGDWPEELEGLLETIAGVRAELVAGDLRPLYLAWLAAYGTWERDEGAFDDEHESRCEPPVPAGLGSLTEPQRALAEILRLDTDLLAVAVEASPPLPSAADGDGRWAGLIGSLPEAEKDALLLRVVRDEAARVRLELLNRFQAPSRSGEGPRRTVGGLLDAAAEARAERET
ncbi:hypothetical protein [Actinocorallia populi]|uniref:hypothetical protein n=1 Tax=Actinocorallia populi TaxID=2079200 RepID=UPI000D087A4B|nr:hypothetical protein [Actinocorallia populi]